MKNLMLVLLFILPVLTGLKAQATEISCLRDDEGDDWSITGTLGGESLSLFDNDSYSTFVRDRRQEDSPLYFMYIEKGSPENVISVRVPNAGKVTALYYAKGDRPEDIIAFTCSTTAGGKDQ